MSKNVIYYRAIIIESETKKGKRKYAPKKTDTKCTNKNVNQKHKLKQKHRYST